MSSLRNSPCAPNPRRSDRGSAVITVLILAAVTAVLASSFLFRAAQEAKLASRSYFHSVALNLAEAGIEEAIHSINLNVVESGGTWTLAAGSTTDYTRTITGFNYGQGTGVLHVRIDNAITTTPTITAAGVITIPNQPTIVKQLRVVGIGPARLWRNSIVAKGNVTFDGSADIDSYDSALGAYNSSTNRTDRATVATNATVQVIGSATIYGYVATNNTDPSVGSSGRIYGATSPSSPLVDPSRVRKDFSANLADATAPTTAAISLGAYTASGSASLPRVGDTAGANGRYLYTCTSLSIGGSNSLSVKGPVDIIVTGNIQVDGSGYLALGGTGSVDPSLNIYCPGTINFTGSGMVNHTTTPVKACIWGTQPAGSTQTITIGGSSAFYGTVYAPNADVTVNGSGGLYGAIVGKTAVISGSGDVHYDTQLEDVAYGYLRVSGWAELTRAPSSGHAFARDNRAPFASLF